MTKSTHPALAQAPKTTREALERALNYAKTHELAKYHYVNYNGDCCIIGQFFTPEQRKLIRTTDTPSGSLNEKDVFELAGRIGKKNLKAMTGLTVKQAAALQFQNDNTSKEMLIFNIERVLSGQTNTITGEVFTL